MPHQRCQAGLVASGDETASAPAGHQNLFICVHGSVPGVGENDFLDLALGQYGNDEYFPESGSEGFFRLFYSYAGGSSWLAGLTEITSI